MVKIRILHSPNMAKIRIPHSPNMVKIRIPHSPNMVKIKIPLTSLTQTHICALPKPVPGFPTTYVVFAAM